MIEITAFVKDGGPLSKKLSLGDDGKVIADGSACVMSRGRACRIPITSLNELAKLIDGLGSAEAIALGTLRPGLPDMVDIVSQRRINGTPQPNTIPRTASNLIFAPNAPAVTLLDYDQKGMPAEVAARLEAIGGFWPALATAVPALKRTARVIRASTSAGLINTETGERYSGSGGQHAYVVVANAEDVPRFVKDLHCRCILAGYGWHMLGASGSLLERSIIDASVGSPERLIFEGAPIVVAPLMQEKRRARFTIGKPMIDTLDACPALTPSENQALDKWRAEERLRLEPAARRVREAWIKDHAAKLAQREGIAPEKARQIVERQCGGVLLSAIALEFDDPELAGRTVADVLAEPERYDGETLADPIEGIGYGRGKAKVMIGDGGVVIHSFAHGLGTVFKLRHDAAAVRAAIDAVAKQDAPAVYLRMNRSATLDGAEREILEKYAAARAGIGVKVLRQMVADAEADDERQKADTHNRRRRVEESRASMHVPGGHGERLPVIEPADRSLADRQAEVPPMRDAEGVPLEVRHRAPPMLHEALEPDDNEEAMEP